MSDGRHTGLTKQIIGGFYAVYNSLGYGFLERVYENALMIELRSRGLEPEQQKPITVYYRGEPVGEYFADIVVANMVIVELKAIQELGKAHEAQLLNYLKATTIEVGLLLNFGPKPEVRRKLYDNERKGSLNWLHDTENK